MFNAPDSTFSQGRSAFPPIKNQCFLRRTTTEKVESAGTLECPKRIPGFKILNPPDRPRRRLIVEESMGARGAPASLPPPSPCCGGGPGDGAA